MQTKGRTHLGDPRSRAVVVLLASLGPSLIALGALAPRGPVRITLVALGLLVLVSVARVFYIVVAGIVRRARPIRDRVAAQKALDATLVVARRLNFDAEVSTALLLDAWRWGELAMVQKVAAEILAAETTRAQSANGVPDTASALALALDALAAAATGDVDGASRQLALYDERCATELSAALSGAHHRAYAEVARAWVRFRQGATRDAIDGLSAYRSTIAAQDGALRAVADALVRADDFEASPAHAHYRSSARARSSAAFLQASHTHLDPHYPTGAIGKVALLALDRSREPLALPGPFVMRLPSRWWLPWLASLLPLALTTFALRTQRPFLMIVSTIALCWSVVQGLRGVLPKASTDTEAEDVARFAAAESLVHRDRPAAIAALEALAERKHGMVAAEAAVRRAVLASLDGDAALSLHWYEHALSTLHSLTTLRARVSALRARACAERAVQLAALDRADDAERTILLLGSFPEVAACTAWVVRIVVALRSGHDDRARALAEVAPLDSLNGFTQLLRDAALAPEDASVADDVRARLADWPDGCRYLQMLAPRAAEPLLPRVRVAPVAADPSDDSDEAREPSVVAKADDSFAK